MSDFNEPAHPAAKRVVEKYMDEGGYGRTRTVTVTTPGLTIRQQAVLMAMQGILSREDTDVERKETLLEVTKAAIFVADAVLRLERETRDE